MKNVISVMSVGLGLWIGAGSGPVAAQSSTAQDAMAGSKTGGLGPITVQDKLRFRIVEDPSQSEEPIELGVTTLGEVNFPVSAGFNAYITLNVLGKTVDNVKQELKTKLNAAYYKNATVALQRVSPGLRAGQVHVFGEFQGCIALSPGAPKTVSAGILEFGVNEFANFKKIRIHRFDQTTLKTTKITVNVQKVLEGDHSQDVALQDGDRIEVPGKSILF